MTYFPMFVSLEGESCLIVGGGKVAARKCRGLLSFGASVTVVARQFTEDFVLHDRREPERSAEGGGRKPVQRAEGRVRRLRRAFRPEDVTKRRWALVVAATDDRETNRTIGALCRAGQIPVNVADSREECTFFFPALCMEENVAVGITTSGQDPALAGRLRRRVEEVLPEWIREISGAGRETEADE